MWRWFFGSSKEFVQQAIQQYGGTPVAESMTSGDLMQNVVNDLDAFWRDVVSYTPYDYQSPHVVAVPEGQSAQSACGPAEGNFAAFYCPPDMTLYLDESFLLSIQQQAPFAAAFVIAHEWAHHIQSGVGLVRVGPSEEPQEWNEVYSIELELMADCFAGVWAQDANTRGLLEAAAIDQAVQLALQMLGDPQFVGPYDPQAHGTGEQRATSIMNGYDQGFLGCNVKL
jgi:predicted metalloprotease